MSSAATFQIPDGITVGQAATLVQSYATARFALTRRTHVEPGEWVAVLGAGGGVGLATIDVAKVRGAHVVACASSHGKLDAARSAGADAIVAYEDEGVDLKAAIREATGGGADVVVDPVGGDKADRALRSILAWLGGSLDRATTRALADELPVDLRDAALGAPPPPDRLPPGLVIEYADVTCRLLAARLTPELAHRLRAVLPAPWSERFTRRAPTDPPPRRDVAGHTLASGRPGSRHPVGEYGVERAQSDSVVRASNPHAWSSSAPSRARRCWNKSSSSG